MAPRRARAASLIAALACVAGTAFPAAGETLIDAVAAAYANNPKVNAERARQRSDIQKIPQARAGLLPVIAGTADHGYDRLEDRSRHSVSVAATSGVGATLSQPLFDGFRTINDVRRARAEVFAGKETLDAVSSDVLLLTVQAYADVIRDRRIEALRRQAVSVFRQQVAQAEGRYKGGDLTRTGVDQALTRLAESESDLAQARADLARSEALYRSVVGHQPGNLVQPRFARIVTPPLLADALRIGEEHNANLRAARYRLLAADYAADVAKGALAPTVSFDAYIRRTNNVDVNGVEPQEGSARFKVSVPIFNGGRDASKITQAVETKSQRRLEVEDARLAMRKTIESTWEAISGANRRMAASQARLKSAEQALKGLEIEFNAGQIPIVNVLDGRREAIAAKVAAVTAERDRLYETFVLLSALGQLALDRPTVLASLLAPDAAAAPMAETAHLPASVRIAAKQPVKAPERPPAVSINKAQEPAARESARAWTETARIAGTLAPAEADTREPARPTPAVKYVELRPEKAQARKPAQPDPDRSPPREARARALAPTIAEGRAAKTQAPLERPLSDAWYGVAGNQ